MRYKSLALSAFSLLLLFTTLHLCSSVARAADDDERANDDSYAETARVMRVSLIAGDVNLRRAGSEKWERATPNVPLVEGDRLATGANSHVEIQIDARNFLRVGEYATLDVVTLRDEGVALSLPEGTATLRLARFNHDHEYFEIDAPGTTIAAEKEGLYRLDVDRDGKVRVAVRDGGRARLYSQNSGFTLRDGRVAEMVLADNSQEPDWQFSDLRPFDSWDTWVDERERYLIARLNYDGRDRYYDDQVFGAEELDSYGDWVSTHDYGYVWRPRTTVINNYQNWAPYRYGRWDWCDPYGWVWVGDEPWGWAPYHYGRWVYVDNYWCWAPRGYAGYQRRSWWRPALVSFVNLNISFGGGDHICWYPLPYHHRDPQSNFWRRLTRERRDAFTREESANLKHLPPGFERAVSGLPKGDFGKGNLRPRPADAQTAKLALATDPVRGRLPVRPVEGNGLSAETRARLGESKRAALVSGGVGSASDPLRHILERPTGAASRKPGVALDDQLRRERILNNREPIPSRVSADAKGGALKETNGTDPNRRITDGDLNRRLSGEDSNSRSTGAVARPARPVRLPDANNAGGATDSRGAKNGADDPKRTIRPVRPTPEMENGRPRDAIVNDPSARKTKPDTRDVTNERERTRPEYDRPSPPREERREPPAERRESPPERRAEPAPRNERPEPRREERPSPPPREERSTPPPRVERSAPREERSAPHESRSSSESKSSSSSKSETHSDSSHPSHSKPPVR